MSLEKMLELNTAAITRLADLMERFKPNAATSETETPKAEKGTVMGREILREMDKLDAAPKKKAPVKKEEPKAETMASVVQEMVDDDERLKAEVKEEPKVEIVEEVKEVELVDIQKVARALVIKGKDVKAAALAAIEGIAGKGAKIHSLDKKFYAEVLAALEALQSNLEEI